MQSYNQISASDTALQLQVSPPETGLHLEVSPPQTGLQHTHKVSPPWTGLQHGFISPPAQQRFHNMGICSSAAHNHTKWFYYFSITFLSCFSAIFISSIDDLHLRWTCEGWRFCAAAVALLVEDRARHLWNARSCSNTQCLYFMQTKILKHSQCWRMYDKF